MTGKRKLTERQRRVLIVTGAVESAMKAVMLVDLKRRPASQVRGPKWAWALSTLINSAGIVPVVYFVVGRTR